MKVSADTLDQIFISQGRVLRHESFISSPTAQFENVLTGEKITVTVDSAMVDDLELADSQAVSNLVYGVYELQEKYDKVLNESIDFHLEKSELQQRLGALQLRIAELQEENAALRANNWDSLTDAQKSTHQRYQKLKSDNDRREGVDEGVDRGVADDVAPMPGQANIKDKDVCRTRRRRQVLLPYRDEPYKSGTMVVIDEKITSHGIPHARVYWGDPYESARIYTLLDRYDPDLSNPQKLPFTAWVYE